MSKKRVISITIVFALVISIAFSSMAYAESISEEKLKLMMAAGETLQPNQISEADVKVKKDEAIKIAKTMLENADLYDVGYIVLNARWGMSGNVWQIEFYRRATYSGNASFSISADTGEIIAFNIWQGSDPQTNHIARFTRDEAKDKALSFIKDSLKEDVDSFELQKNVPYDYYGYRMGGIKEPVTYNYSFVKKVNGIILPNYNINIGVDGTNGKITSFNINRVDIDKIKFPSANEVVEKDKALQTYRNSLDANLQYITYYDYRPYGQSNPKIMLAYVPTAYISMIDAMSGKAVDYNGTVIDSLPQPVDDTAGNLIPMYPYAELRDKAVSEEEAKVIAEDYRKIVEQLLNITFDDNAQRPYYPANEDDVWRFDWYKNKEYGNMNFNIAISAKTGHILQLNLGNYDYSWEIKMKMGEQPPEVIEKISWAGGKGKSLELIKKLIPDQYGFFVDENINAPEFNDESNKYVREYYYNFTRLVNGLKYQDNHIGVSVDRETGEIRNFNFNWTDAVFPSTKDIVSKQYALDKYLQGTEIRLQYLIPTTYDNEGRPSFGDAAMLVYSVSPNNYFMYGGLLINAVTGNIVDGAGKEFKPESFSEDNNLPSHWAKRNVELLISQGILKDSDVEYDKTITRAEAVKMLVLAKGVYYYEPAYVEEKSFTDVAKDDPDYFYIENAVRQKILTETGGEFKGSEKISKLEFVKLLVNLTGHSDIAIYKDIFKVSGVKNVNEKMIGYVAICSALDILPVDPSESFDGNAKVTYAEASSALYKALSFIR